MSSLTSLFAKPIVVNVIILYVGLMASGCSTTNISDIAPDYQNVVSVYRDEIAYITMQNDPAYKKHVENRLQLFRVMTFEDAMILQFLLEKHPDRIITQAGKAPWIIFEPSEDDIACLMKKPEYRNATIMRDDLLAKWIDNPNQKEVAKSERNAVRSDAGKAAQRIRDRHLNRIISQIREVQANWDGNITHSNSPSEPKQPCGMVNESEDESE